MQFTFKIFYTFNYLVDNLNNNTEDLHFYGVNFLYIIF